MYRITATRLNQFSQCAHSYWLRFEKKLPGSVFFGSTDLGTALHQALARAYRDWDYLSPTPSFDWFEACWSEQIPKLSPAQAEEGRKILHTYYSAQIAGKTLVRPLGVEGKIQGILRLRNVEFAVSGRYDRLDSLGTPSDAGLHLVDYKSSKSLVPPDPLFLDIQLGLYYLALEQHYPQSLRRLSLVYLRTGEAVSFEATPDHRAQAEELIADLAIRLREDNQWHPDPGDHCQRCRYTRYCAAVQENPEPLPDSACPSLPLQLVLSV